MLSKIASKVLLYHVGPSSIGSDLPSSPPDTADSTIVRKKGRGVTKNVKWFKKFKPGEKSAVTIDSDLRRAVAGDVVPFITEMGVVLRQYTVLSNKRWKEVPNHIKQKMFDDLLGKFDGIQGEKVNVLDHLKKMYREWRHRLHRYYLRFNSDEERLTKVPENVTDNDWRYLVKYFGSEEFKYLSARNKNNRAKQGISTIKGRTSFVRIRYNMRDPVTQAEPKMTDYWKATHLRHNGDWMDGRSKDVMETLEDIEKEQLQSGGPLLTPEEQMSKACGTRSGYIRGLGCGPRPSSRRGAEFREAYQREVEDLRGALERQQQEAENREQRLRLEAEEREHRLRLEAEERERHFRIEAEERECRLRLEAEERERRIRSEMRSEICAEFQAQLQMIMAHIPGLQNVHSTSSTSDGYPISINTLLLILVN
uniref:Transposase, Ptta/En/Spm, plant n=1 Tax=Ananas comosus var. bracteatus TaxID=296719 RepID=A0A6V7PZW5_ANACO|nr:unnamed protein product [Ananas comosus var. bracteatus]